VKKGDKLGLFANLEEPDIGNPICVHVNGKRISQDISNSYMEYSFVREALDIQFPKIKVLAEIGGGYGRLIYLFHRFHQRDGLKVVMIDLPPALFIAQWYMRSAFPDSRIMVYRNFSNFEEIKEEFDRASICFLLPHQLALLPSNLIDLLINVSSLHEMSRVQINHYYELIDEKTRFFYTKQYLLWENPDDKICVPAVIYPTRPSWELVNARLNPVHTDFFEAIFRTKQS
jgi:putative sugar O-methyltransferase